MKMMENMMSFMMSRMSKDDKEEMMETMMGKMLGDMSSEERMEMAGAMMPKMMEGMNMADMMSKMTGAGGMQEADASGAGMPMGGMMVKMMPHCMKMVAKQTPADKRQDALVDLLVAMLEAGCESMETDERTALLQALQSRIEAMKATTTA